MNIKTPKKLIEVALPLDEINSASALEKSIRKGHPSTLHMWWARRPLISARAMLFAQLVNDPGGARGWSKTKNKEQVAKERQKLFEILLELCKWENNDNQALMNKARSLIRESWKETCELNSGMKLDAEEGLSFLDPFSGGATLPIEADRLGLDVTASDLNPIPVMIGKGALEYPKKIKKYAPINSGASQLTVDGCFGYDGIAEDVVYYGNRLLDNVRGKVGSLYPMLKDPSTGVDELVIAWIWARTVKSPSPAFGDCEVPLIKSFKLSAKGRGKYLRPVVFNYGKSWRFDIVDSSEKPEMDGTVGRKGATCILSGATIPLNYIRDQGKKGLIGHRLVAIVTKRPKGRGYYPADSSHEKIAKDVFVEDFPDAPIDHWAGCTNSVVYGMDRFASLFTSRQLKTMVALSDGVYDVYKDIMKDFAKKYPGLENECALYATAICLYLSFAVSKTANRSNSLSAWMSSVECPGHLFSKHAIPMNWDYSETNVLYGPSGSFYSMLETTADGLKKCYTGSNSSARSCAENASSAVATQNLVISTDPPYYDNIPYSNLADFFYLWLRRSLKPIAPDLVATLQTPKEEELVANQFRHGGRESAEKFFMDGMTSVFKNLKNISSPFYPITIYYAFKQSETKGSDTLSKGWETFIDAIISSGLMITGTWPLRTERENRSRSQGANALASSIVLVCRPQSVSAQTISRRDFIKELRNDLPDSLDTMISGGLGVSPIAPVDLAQSAIGPGMAIFSRYKAVLNQDGSRMGVHEALILINRAISDYLNPDSGSFDADTLFCDDWFAQYGWSAGAFGDADTLARAKGTSVDGVHSAGVIVSGSGKVRLLKWSEYPSDWDPRNDTRTPVWEACHQMIRALNQQGEAAAGALLARMPEQGEPIRQLAYHLYTLCERKKWAEEARAYNELIGSWHAIVAASHDTGHRDEQIGLEL